MKLRELVTRFVACGIIIARLTSCVNTSGWIKECDHSLPERGKWENPVYPAAQNVKHEQGTCCDEVTATFETRDSPELVLAYYERTLIEAGWKRDNRPNNTEHDLYFIIANCCYFGTATVDATSARQGVTTVKVTNSWSMGCG